MLNTIAAVYEQGVLRPLMPLPLREHQRVQVQIIAEEPMETAEQILRQLVATGLISPPCCPKEDAPVPDAARPELARILGEAASVPLSQSILDERD